MIEDFWVSFQKYWKCFSSSGLCWWPGLPCLKREFVDWSILFRVLCLLLFQEEATSLFYGGIPSVFLVFNPCRFILYMINNIASARGNIGKYWMYKNYAEICLAWNASYVLVHKLLLLKQLKDLTVTQISSWKSRVIALTLIFFIVCRD